MTGDRLLRWAAAGRAVFAALVLLALVQPLFRTERNWSVVVAGKRYGVNDVVETPADRRWTQIWFADHLFQPSFHPEEWWVLAVPPVALVLAARALTRPRQPARRP
jgi:hypothetical protein